MHQYAKRGPSLVLVYDARAVYFLNSTDTVFFMAAAMDRYNSMLKSYFYVKVKGKGKVPLFTLDNPKSCLSCSP